MLYRLIEIKDIDYGDFKGNIALIERKMNTECPEYAVVRNLDLSKPMESNDQWDNTITYTLHTIRGLQSCVDIFRSKTEDDYISRARLEELATLFKDGLIEDDRENASQYFDEVCEMTEYEENYFGVECNDEEE